MKKSRERVAKLQLKWQMSLPGKLWARLIRGIKQQRSGMPQVKKKGNFLLNIWQQIWWRLKWLLGWNKMGTKLGVTLVVVAPLAIIALFLSVQLHPNKYAENIVNPQLYGNSTNVALIVYEDSGDYTFVDYIAVLSWNPRDKENSLIVINPEFGTSVIPKRTVKLRSLLSNASLEKLDGMPQLILALRNLLAMPIDRYLAVSKPAALRMIQSLGVQYTSTESFSDIFAGEFATGENLGSDRLANYLAATNAGINSKLQRVATFGKTQLENVANFGGMMRLIFDSGELVDDLETNLSKPEILNMMLTALGGVRVQSTYLSANEGRFVNNTLGGYLSPNYALIDQKIQKTIARSDVVKEQARIEVYNATRTSGLATFTKRLVENLGCNVTRTGNNAEIEERTKLYVRDVSKYKNNILAIQEVLRGKVILVNDDFPQGHTGDMVLVIGNDNAT